MFRNRADAGRQLAVALAHLRALDVVVLGLPRGGVTAFPEVAAALGAPLDVVVVRKLGVPTQPELAMGAIGEGASLSSIATSCSPPGSMRGTSRPSNTPNTSSSNGGPPRTGAAEAATRALGIGRAGHRHLSESVQPWRLRWSMIHNMSGFSAVVTTGIYCRPGCGGRPKPANVRPYALAAAAEAAGYRACLRCRPYRSDPPFNPDAPELVCRAVQLVVDGLLDDNTEEALGKRLGVSARHLRRLFELHLGVTPDQLARSRRAHFARRLLDDTDLSFAQIAFASGFGSIRQFNRVCRDVFSASPRELRARRRASDRLVADGGLALRLPFTQPLEWDTMLEYFDSRAIPGVEHVSGGTYRRTVVIDGDPGVIELSRGGEDHLVLVAHLPHWEGLIHVVERARRIFGLDLDLEVANERLGDDPNIGPLVRKSPGLRTPGTWDPFEAAVRAICGQMVSVASASTIVRRIVERHGTEVPGLQTLGLSRVFPSARDPRRRRPRRSRPHCHPGRSGSRAGPGGRRRVAPSRPRSLAGALRRLDVPAPRPWTLDGALPGLAGRRPRRLPGVGPRSPASPRAPAGPAGLDTRRRGGKRRVAALALGRGHPPVVPTRHSVRGGTRLTSVFPDRQHARTAPAETGPGACVPNGFSASRRELRRRLARGRPRLFCRRCLGCFGSWARTSHAARSCVLDRDVLCRGRTPALDIVLATG